MIIEKEIRKLFHQLIHDDVAHIQLGGSEITVSVFEHASKISLSTPVYFGGNFIPKSVRKCVAQKPPFASEALIDTYLTVDEKNYQIFLNYLGQVKGLNNTRFVELLEEFSWQADEWRLRLDEHDKNDLIHVRVK